jgi:hypothetical protein
MVDRKIFTRIYLCIQGCFKGTARVVGTSHPWTHKNDHYLKVLWENHTALEEYPKFFQEKFDIKRSLKAFKARCRIKRFSGSEMGHEWASDQLNLVWDCFCLGLTQSEVCKKYWQRCGTGRSKRALAKMVINEGHWRHPGEDKGTLDCRGRTISQKLARSYAARPRRRIPLEIGNGSERAKKVRAGTNVLQQEAYLTMLCADKEFQAQQHRCLPAPRYDQQIRQTSSGKKSWYWNAPVY